MPYSLLTSAPPAQNNNLFGRRVKLTIAPPVAGSFKTAKTQSAMVITDLRVTFRIIRSLRKEPNTGDITVYNLNSNSRAQLQEKGARCWFDAGYAGASALTQYFSGDVRFIDHKRDKADWQTKLELGDGERAFKYGHCNRSFGAGTKNRDIIQWLAQTSGWDLGNVTSLLSSIPGSQLNGYSTFGRPEAALTEILQSQGLSWSVQDGSIQILPQAGFLAGTAVQLDEDHGLVGSPEFGSAPKQGKPRMLKVKALLQPGLFPGLRVNLVSQSHVGVFTIQKAEYSGDSYGGDFYAQMELLP